MAQQHSTAPRPGETAQRPAPAEFSHRGDPHRSSTALISLLAIGVCIALGLAIWGLLREESAEPVIGVTAGDIVDDPDAWYGTSVVVSGPVGEAMQVGATRGDTATAQGVAFTLGGDSPGEQLLVIRPAPDSAFVDENSVVHVTGTVREFDANTFNRAFGVDGAPQALFDSARFGDWSGRPVVVAQSVDPTIPPEYIRP